MNVRNYKWKSVLVLILLFLVLLGFRLLWLAYHFPSDQPLAHNGALDLRAYELKDDKTITLNGEWKFSEGHFPRNNELQNVEWKTLDVPTSSADDIIAKYGTYRLKIMLNEKDQKERTYGFQIPSVKTASALFIDGEQKGKSGVVADNPTQHIGKDTPYTVYFTTDQKEIDIILYVSNFDTDENIGIHKSIKFGSAEAISKERDFIKTLLTGMVVVLLLHSLYSLLVYFFIYRNKMVLFFTIGFIFPALDEIITYDKSIIDWLQLDYPWSLKLTNLLYLAASFFFVQFMRVLLTKYRQHKLFYLFSVLYGICAALILIMPVQYLLPANAVFFVLYFVSFLSVLLFAFQEFMQDQKESFYLALIMVSTTSGIVWGLIKAFAQIEIPFYPFDYLFAFLGFAAFWFKRYDQKHKEAAELVVKLQKEDTLKDEFLKSSAEKLWTPLNEMITIAQTIIDGKRSSLATQDKNDLLFLINIGRTMFFTLQDLVDFTRLKEGKLPFQPKSLRIQGVISGVMDMLTFFADGKQIQMTSNIPSSFPHVMADERRLIQILFNLLHNAISFTNVGEITVDAEIKNNMAVIHVRDNGIGIDEEMKKKVFASYEQGVTNEKGMGLGLTLSKYLIELHGGTVHLDTVPNQGSDFYFTLPLAEEKAAAVSQQEVKTNEEKYPQNTEDINVQKVKDSKGKYRILAIDDDPVSLKVISTIFQTENYHVTTVTDAQKVMHLLNGNEWDLVIVDAMLPYLSGYELTRLIRERYTSLELPILIITSRNYPQDVYVGFSYGANDYVVRPINSLELKTRGKALINMKHSINERLYMEAAWLQAQIQPHFLFNTLNTIASLSMIDSDRMVALLNKFGEYLRRSFTPENVKRIVPLEHELELVKSYLYIEKERFADRLQVEWELEENIGVKLPPLTIQPLVENSIHHGILQKRAGGTLRISIKAVANFIKITVTDNGVGMDEEQIRKILHGKLDTSVGLTNINRRLQQIYGDGLHIQSTRNQGTEVSFQIPKKEM